MSDDRTIISRRPANPTIEPGTRLNGIFEIERQIGSGGMGRVYRARNVDTGDAVAVKVVRPEMASNPQVIALFRKEAAVLNKLLHDAIVRYYLLTTDPVIDLPYLVTEFVDGTPLSDIVERGPLPRDEVLALGERLADGLGSAHKLEIIHRDISPDNIILPEEDVRKAKIIDFGIARASKLGVGTMIGDSVAGKFDYMSPEQVGLNNSVDARSDIYSLGIVLAEAYLGKSLGMGGTQYDVLRKRQEDPDLTAIEPRLRAVIAAMMRPKPEDRLQSMTEVSARLRTLLGSAGIVETERRRRMLPLAVAAVLVAALGAGAYVAFGPDDGTEVPGLDDPGTATPRLVPPNREPPLTPPTGTTTDTVPSGLPSENAAREAAAANEPAPRTDPTASPAPQSRQTVAASTERPSSDRLDDAEPLADAGQATPPRTEPPPAVQVRSTSPPGPALQAGPPEQAAPRPEPLAPLPQQSRTAAAAAGTETAPAPDATASGTATETDADTAADQRGAAPALQSPSPVPPAPVEPAPSIGPDVDLDAIDPDSALNPVGPEFGILRYVRQYDAGPCTLLRLSSFGPRRAAVVGYGPSEAPFAQFDADFRESFGFEAQIKLGLVTPEQCPVVDFLERVGPGDDSSLRMQLDNETVAPGDTLTGAITGLDARDVAIFLVDDDGTVYGVNQLVSRGKDEATVHINIAMQDEADRGTRPQLLVAVAGANVAPLSGRPTDAATAVAKLDQALASSGTLETTVGYYRFGR